ncbi:MAG: sorbitol dehydrogenase [Roseomonas sp.]|nr:sorbitol dehydrogenase [Roseomonas sp.]
MAGWPRRSCCQREKLILNDTLEPRNLALVEPLSVGFAGRVVYVEYSKAPVTYETQAFNLKELDILGSRNAVLEDFHAVVTYLEGMGAEADALISPVVAFEEAEQANPFWDSHRDTLKVVVAR